MSDKSPAFQFYPKEYLASEKVAMMDLSIEGPYLRALCYCWLNGSIPKDPEQLARLIGKGCSVDAARVVQGCFNQHPTDPLRMTHYRLDAEREKQRAWAEKSANGGKKSGQIRKEKAKSKGGSRVVEPNTNIAFASPSTSTIKEETHIQAFQDFWESYPLRNGKKVGKQSALTRFKKIPESDLLRVIANAKNYGVNNQYPKDPERFLKDDFWKDWDYPQSKQKEKPQYRQPQGALT